MDQVHSVMKSYQTSFRPKWSPTHLSVISIFLLILLRWSSVSNMTSDNPKTWVQIPGGYRGYSPSKNLSEAAKYCISPQKMTKKPTSHKKNPPPLLKNNFT